MDKVTSLLNSRHKVLVLGVDDRSALTVVRSLGRRGIEVHLGCDTPTSICAYSRYTAHVVRFPDAGKEGDAWLSHLESTLRHVQYDLVIPTVDKYLVPVIQHREALEKLARFAIPDQRGFLCTYNKSRTLDLAQSLGIPCPETTEMSAIEDVQELITRHRLPVIVKPISSKVWQSRARHDLKVELVHTRAALEAKLTQLLPICPVLIQSVHKGIGVGLEFLTNRGDLVAVFQHERVHEPKKGGGSSYRKSTAVDPLLLDYSMRMLRDLAWTGVAMVEYKCDVATHESVLMEINGRFWGSLPLAVAAGVDFPALLYDLLVHNKIPEKVNYRKNLYGRNLVKDLDWLKENIRADKRDPYTLSLPWYKVLGEIRHVLLCRERYDTLVWDDMRPGLLQLCEYARANVAGAREKLSRAALQGHYHYNPSSAWLQRWKIRRLLAKNPVVSFICKGNICRSPFASIYLQSLIGQGTLGQLSVDSCGLIEQENRRSPELAIEAAASFGVDMSNHRSRVLTADIVHRAGVLFVMDIDLYRRVRKLYPRAKGKLFFLGALHNDRTSSLDIADPYGQSLEKFQQIFARIIGAIDNFVKLAKN